MCFIFYKAIIVGVLWVWLACVYYHQSSKTPTRCIKNIEYLKLCMLGALSVHHQLLNCAGFGVM